MGLKERNLQEKAGRVYPVRAYRATSRNQEVSNGVKVKICGITNLNDAISAQKSGADALGFVFYFPSPRYIKLQAAKKIISKLNKKIKKVGVFVNAKAGYIKKIASACKLDMLQFHGSESPDFCQGFKGYEVIKAFRIKDKSSFKDIKNYKVDCYLFDTFKRGLFGATGTKFKWSLLKNAKINKPFFLSGGLNSKNVLAAIKAVRPVWVDGSSGVELSPGIKGKQLLEGFIKKVKSL